MCVRPTKASAGGCVAGFFGLLFIAFGGLCGWGFFEALGLPLEKRSSEMLWFLGVSALGGILFGLGLVVGGLKWALKADMKEPYSRDKPGIRF